MNRRRLLRFASILILILVALAGATSPAKKVARPKLVVLLVVDQMRADYIDRFSANWHSGLRRLVDQGAWYIDAAYPYANTFTCVGHSTIGTGDFPATHGMINNEWWDRATQRQVACTNDPQAIAIPYRADAQSSKSGDSDARSEAPSFAEQLRAQSVGSRVVTLSLKARAAIPLAGHHADSVTWLDGDHWATSSAYSSSPVPAVQTFVAAHRIEADLGKTWTDSAAASGDKPSLSSHFPHALGTPEAKPNAAFYRAWGGSPFSDAYLGQMAEAEVDGLKLGQESGIDFLGISFSALDIVGHQYGPQSAEIRDILAHLDETLGALFEHLDQTVGRGNYVVALTADHGVAPIPEVAGKEGIDAGRADVGAVTQAVEQALAPFGLSEHPVAAFDDSDFYFVPGVYEKLKANPKAMDAAIAAIHGIAGVAEVFRGDQLATTALTNQIAHAASLSYFPGRSGDLVVITKPFWFFDEKRDGAWGGGTTHGTPYPYDQHVPVLLMGAMVHGGKYPGKFSPADIVRTLAKICNIEIAHTDGPPLPLP
jgi:predicted AlkP superfamily pyrophosphatase or phosphodiesterase